MVAEGTISGPNQIAQTRAAAVIQYMPILRNADSRQ